MKQKWALVRSSFMHPLAYRLLYAWTTVATLVGMVDSYSGMQCAGRTGNYAIHMADPAANTVVSAVEALPYGAVRGALYNVSNALGTESSCGKSYTHQFAGGLSHLFNVPVAGKVYRLSQVVFGLGGGAIGGMAAEEVHVFHHAPAIK